MDEDRLLSLRRAMYSGDPASMVTAVIEHGFVPSVQLAGDVVRQALSADAAGSQDLADRCASFLVERGWEGDPELADALRGTGTGLNGQPLVDLPIDLEDLYEILEGDPLYGGGRVDLRTGEVWPQSTFDEGTLEDDDEDEDPDRWLSVWCEGSSDGYRDMADFADSCTDQLLLDKLNVALNGRGAFRRFRDVLLDHPAERADWFAFSDDRRRGRARAWLADAGYRAVFRPIGV